jgi:cysteine desulfurase
MHVPDDRLRSSVRFSLGAGTTTAEIEAALDRIVALVGRIARAGPARFSGAGPDPWPP